MNCSAWHDKLHDHLDGTLSAADTPALESHLANCPACRAQLASLRALRTATQNLPRSLPPSRDLWPEIETHLNAPRSSRGNEAGPPALAPTPRVLFRSPLLKLAAALALLLTAFAAWRLLAPARPSPALATWPVASLAGAPRIDTKNFSGESRLRVGQWLETDAASRAKLTVGAIGEVNIDPNSRVRLANAAATDHRLELARGQLSALIWAPPRVFFVETPAATAVDLGCAYTLNVDDAGHGTLHVTAGYVALAHAGRETLVTYGQKCTTRRGAGPGTPFVADAPDSLRRALDRFDVERDTAALADILALVRPADGPTLWHLLARTTAAARTAVFDTLARLHPPPEGVTRPGILAADPQMLAAWAATIGFHIPASR